MSGFSTIDGTAAHAALTTTHGGALQTATMKNVANGIAGLDGSAGLVLGGKLAVKQITLTGNIEIDSGWMVIFANATDGAITFNGLPSAVSVPGRILIFKKVDASANNVVIDPPGAQTIDGAETYTLATQNKYVVIISDATNWKICGNN